MSNLSSLRLSQELLDPARIKAELSRRKLHRFLKDFAWPALQPGTRFIDNWHIGAICEHLEAVKLGQIRRLIVNMPFRLLKSTIISQAFPAWEWIDSPHMQYLTASYAKDIAMRDAVNSRRVIESDAYQAAWSDKFRMTSDQNVKQRYENDKGGSRTISSTDGAATGFGGNRVLVDDPISAKDADSAVARESAVEFWRGSVSTRLNNPAEDAIVVVHQRLNEGDLTGYILAEEKGWEHLILPMRYEPEYRKTTSIGFQDPRTVEGELLFPARLDEAAVSAIERTIGSHHVAAQLQQRPNKRGGKIIKGEWFKRYSVLPKMIYRKIYADTAQKTKERNDYTVFECWGLGEDGRIYLLDLLRDKWEAPELKRKAIDFWAKHLPEGVLSGALRKMCIEDKASGTGLIQDIQKDGKIPVEAIQRATDKLVRVMDGVGFIEAGLVCIPEDAPWVADFIAECEAFTDNDSHAHDDQIDPLMDAIKDMLGVGNSGGLTFA